MGRDTSLARLQSILKTSGLVDVLRSGLAPRASEISVSYAELFTLLETAPQRLGRAVNPTLYSNDEMTARLGKKNAFITKVFAQDKL